MTDPTSIANALYRPSSPTPAQTAGALYPSTLTAAATPAPTRARPLGSGPERAATPTDMEVTAAALYGGGGEPAPNPEVYDGVLGSSFDALQHQARFDANAEDVEFLGTSRRQASELMHAMQIPVPVARELTVALSGYIESPLSDEALALRNSETEAELRALWKGNYDTQIAAAKRLYAVALKTMPSLAAIVAAGAGSDPKFIKALAAAAGRRKP